MTFDPTSASDLYFEGAVAEQRGDAELATAPWQRLLASLDKHDVSILDIDGGTISRISMVKNLAILCQRTRAYAQMRRYTERLTREQPSASSLQLHATALKNTGDTSQALVAIDDAIRLDPQYANAHHERACILAAAGDLQGALDSVKQAIACGAKPQSLGGDDELDVLRSLPAFEGLVGGDTDNDERSAVNAPDEEFD